MTNIKDEYKYYSSSSFYSLWVFPPQNKWFVTEVLMTSLFRSPWFFPVFSPILTVDVLGIIPSAPTTIGITITFMIHSFFISLARFRHLSIFSLSFIFNQWFTVARGVMDTAARDQILDETDCISYSTYTLGKDMNPIILPPAMDK